MEDKRREKNSEWKKKTDRRKIRMERIQRIPETKEEEERKGNENNVKKYYGRKESKEKERKIERWGKNQNK